MAARSETSASLLPPALALGAVIGALAALFVAFVPAGLPYDEPAHYGTVLFYLQHHRMPTIGEPGSTYEAQMGPVAYVVLALAARAAALAGATSRQAFYLLRAIDALEWLGALGFLLGCLRRLGTTGRSLLLATAFLGPNAMLLAMGASIQNDGGSLLLAFAALFVLLGHRPGTGPLAAAGLLTGLAVLTKITALPLLVGAILVIGWSRRRHARQVLAFAVPALASCGWWFVRNEYQYADATGRRQLKAAGYAFGPLGTSRKALSQLVTGSVQYLWYPREYLRDTFLYPSWLKDATIAFTVAIAVLALGRPAWRPRQPDARLLVALGVLTTAGWAVIALKLQALAPRTAYLALPAVGYALARSWHGRRAGTVLIAAVMILNVTLSVVTLMRANGLPVQPFYLFRSS